LYFNTSPQIEGPGLILSDDLWVVDVDGGELRTLLDPGQGGNFSISPDGKRMAIITPGRIDLMDADGSNRREAFTHTRVITFSEFEYYAQPVWAADSNSLRVAIPPADSSSASSQTTTIWNIPVEDKPAWLIGQLSTLPRTGTPPLFAPNLARIAYLVGESVEGDPNGNLPKMAVSELSENVLWDPVIFPVEVTSVHGWSPDGIRLLFVSPTASVAEITMGQPDSRPLVSGDAPVLNVTWTDNFRFLYQQLNQGGWDILLAGIDGSEPELIDSVTGQPVSYDFTWVTKPAG
jgi:hypothetical protein